MADTDAAATDAGDTDTATPEKGGKLKLLEGKSQKRREQILVVSGVGVLILTLLLLHRSSASAAAASNTTQPAGAGQGVDPNTGMPYQSEVGASATDPNTGAPYSAELAGLQQQLAMATSPGAPISSSPTAISGPTVAPSAGPVPASAAVHGMPAGMTGISQQQSVTVEAAGFTVYGSEPGGGYIPLWQKSGGTTAAFAPYAKQAKNPPLFYNPAQKV